MEISLEMLSYVVFVGMGFSLIGLFVSLIALVSKERVEDTYDDVETEDDDLYKEDLSVTNFEKELEEVDKKEKKGFSLFGKRKKQEEDEDELEVDEDEEDDDILEDEEADNMMDDFKKKMVEREEERERRRLETLKEENERKMKLKEELGKINIRKYAKEDEVELPARRQLDDENEENEILNRLQSLGRKK